MSVTVKLIAWKKWYSVLRRSERFGLLDSVRFGLWLARGSAEWTKQELAMKCPTLCGLQKGSETL